MSRGLGDVYKRQPQDLAKTLAKIGAITTSVNAVIAVIVASIIYLALRPAMKKLNMLRDL